MRGLRTRLSWNADKPVLGIMAFDASKLMSKVVHMWHCLSDGQMMKVREYVVNSIGIKKLVSGDDEYLMDLALAEIIDIFVTVAKSVALLGKKCIDPIYQNLDGIFDDPTEPTKWCEWKYRLKKMEKRVRKMSKFVAATEQLHSEMEVLSEHERILRQLKDSANPGRAKLLEFQQMVELQRQIVKDLLEISPWVRAYDYVVRMLFRSLSTIMERIRYVNGASPTDHRDNSAGLVRGSIFSISLRRSLSNRKSHDRSPSSAFHRRQNQTKVRQFPTVSFNGCVTGGIGSPFVDSYTPTCGSSFRSIGSSSRFFGKVKDLTSNPKASFLDSKRRLLTAPPSTLGDAALALHYANLIILIERLATSPHSIDPDERDDLYDMLTTNIRKGFRSKLKNLSGNRGTFEEWSSALARTFKWISPLAHNMVRWQNERAFERPRSSRGSNVLLVQTLYFADRVEAEAAIVQLLIGLNCLAWFGESSTCCNTTNGMVDDV